MPEICSLESFIKSYQNFKTKGHALLSIGVTHYIPNCTIYTYNVHAELLYSTITLM